MYFLKDPKFLQGSLEEMSELDIEPRFCFSRTKK